LITKWTPDCLAIAALAVVRTELRVLVAAETEPPRAVEVTSVPAPNAQARTRHETRLRLRRFIAPP
jgi:hypothetical protein